MTQFRIACPSCDSIMRLIDRNGQPQKVRCPRCETLFRAEPNAVDMPQAEPAESFSDDPPSPKRNRFKKKAKRESGNSALVGVAVGVAVLALLGGVFGILFAAGVFTKDERAKANDTKPTQSKPKDPPKPPASVPPLGESWMEFSSKKGQFKARMPGAPTEVADSHPGATGEQVPQTKYVYVAPDGSSFLVSFMDFSDKELKARSMTDRYNAVRESFVIKGQIHSEKAIHVQGHPGMELDATYSHEGQRIPVMVRQFPVGNRLYSLRATKKKGDLNKDDVRKFFDSFELTEK